MSKLRLTKSYSDLTESSKLSLSYKLDKEKSVSTRTLDGDSQPNTAHLFLSKPKIKPCEHYISFKEHYKMEIFHGMCRHIISPKYSRGRIYKVCIVMSIVL